jgi:DNA-binding LacI/PurR family transcriptional regulator
VPDDVAVAGFDDIVAGRYNTPSLTTISPDKATIAQLAVDRLIARLAGQVNHEPGELWAPTSSSRARAPPGDLCGRDVWPSTIRFSQLS